MGDPRENATLKDDGLKDQAERVAASQEPLRASHLFRGEPLKFLNATGTRSETRLPSSAEPSKASVWPIVILLILIVAMVAIIGFLAFTFGATPR